MKNNFKSLLSVFAMISLLVPAAACSGTPQPSKNPQVAAIQTICFALGLPELPLEYVEETNMVNSPDGNWRVALYQDSAGRKYYVEIGTNRVVEIDARDLLSRDTTGASALTLKELQNRAENMARAAFPDLSSLEPKLTYEAGQKGDNYFFTWRDDYSPASFNRPFLQLAFVKDGLLFAYYNTLSGK
jgi:hypothetical protein